MTTTYIILGALLVVAIGVFLLGRWIINSTIDIDKIFDFEEEDDNDKLNFA